jgi:hypothetical protein
MKNYYKAISDFQKECPVLPKNTKGYGYNYCKLSTMIPLINPVLEKNGLGYTQPLSTNPSTNRNAIKTTVFHIESGEFETEYWDLPEVDLKGQNRYQSDGSGITYIRRYALAAHLGIVSDEDNDGAGKQTGKPKLTNVQLNELLKGDAETARGALSTYQMTKEQIQKLTNQFKN